MEAKENKAVNYSLSQFRVGREGLEETGDKSVFKFVMGRLGRPTEAEYLKAKENGLQEIIDAYESPNWEGILHSHTLRAILADLKMRQLPGFSIAQAVARLEEGLFWLEKQG